MVYLSEICLIAVSIGMARWHAYLIRPTQKYPQGRPIKHGWWALFFCAFMALAVSWIWRPHLHANAWPLWAYTIAQGCSHFVVFNVMLNRFRGKAWDYVSEDPTSIIDRLEERLFGHRVWILEACLTVAFFSLQPWFRTF